MTGSLKEINADVFKKEVLESPEPVVVDFWAEWCMPCKMLTPTVDELAREYAGKVKFTKVNVDDNTELATDLQILSIPVLIIFKKGKEIKRIVGANPKQEIKREIDEALK